MALPSCADDQTDEHEQKFQHLAQKPRLRDEEPASFEADSAERHQSHRAQIFTAQAKHNGVCLIHEERSEFLKIACIFSNMCSPPYSVGIGETPIGYLCAISQQGIEPNPNGKAREANAFPINLHASLTIG